MRQFESAGDKLPPVNLGDEMEMVLMEKALSRTRHEINSRGLKRPGECKIAIVGVGGCGSNTVNRLMSLGVSGAECVAINTDIQHLDVIHADKKVLIGEKVTQGLGAGNLPYIGRNAMKESVEYVDRLISGNDIVFITAGLGGGTGTGAAPVVAELAKEKGAIVIGVVTMPLHYGNHRQQ
jgi:cell division protein FtsZ